MFHCKEITPGVVRVLMSRSVLGRDLYPAACYAIPAAEVLIDSGSARFAQRTLSYVKNTNLRSILLTHSHEDHSGGAFLISTSLGAECFAHPEALPFLSNPASLGMLAYRKFLFGTPASCTARELGESIETGGGRFRVIYTPGHSKDHVAFLEENHGWLFGGDVYIPARDRVLKGRECNLYTLIDSLRKLASLKATRLFTGMGVIIGNPSKALNEKADRLENISVQVRKFHRQGVDDRQIAKRLFPGDLAVRLATGGDFSARHLVRACLGGRGVSNPED